MICFTDVKAGGIIASNPHAGNENLAIKSAASVKNLRIR